MTARPMPGSAKGELADSEKFQIGDKGRDYRQVNSSNKSAGMDKLRPEDYGRGSRGHSETSRKSR